MAMFRLGSSSKFVIDVKVPPCFLSFFRSKSTQKQGLDYKIKSTADRDHLEIYIRNRCKSKTLDLEEALGLFNYLIPLRARKSSILGFEQLLGAISNMKQYSTVIPLSKVMAFSNIKPSITTLSIPVECYCYMGRVDLGFVVFGSILRHGFRPPVSTLTTLFRGLLGTEKLEGVNNLFSKLRENGYPATCDDDLLMDSLFCHRHRHNAFGLVKLMNHHHHHPSVFIRTGFLHCLFNSFSWRREVNELFMEMLDHRLLPDVPETYTHLIHYFSRQEMFCVAHDLFDSMILRGHQPTTTIYNLLIHGYISISLQNVAQEIFDLMIAPRTTDTYNALLDGYCRPPSSRGVAPYPLDYAVQLVNNMRLHGFTPDTTTYTTLFHHFCKAGNLLPALELSKDFQPNQNYTTFLTRLCTDNHFTKSAIQLFHFMQNKGIEADVDVRCVAIGGMFKTGNLDEARILFDSLSESEIRCNSWVFSRWVFTPMLAHLCKVDKFSEAQNLFNEKEQNCFIIDEAGVEVMHEGCISVHSTILAAMEAVRDEIKEGFSADAGMLIEAKNMFREMKKKGLAPDNVTMGTIVRGCLAYQKNLTETVKNLRLGSGIDAFINEEVLSKVLAKSSETQLDYLFGAFSPVNRVKNPTSIRVTDLI